jgi:hypothetical protein
MNDLQTPDPAGGRAAAPTCRHRGRWVLAVLPVLGLLIGLAGPVAAVADGALAPQRLVIPAARDTSVGFVAVPLPDGGGMVLAWPEGVLVTEEGVAWLPDGPQGLAFDLDGDLRGAGAGGLFTARPGRFTIDTPLYLAAGGVRAYLQAGELTVSDARLEYRRPRSAHDPRGDYLLLAGLVVATGILLHLARRRRRPHR